MTEQERAFNTEILKLNKTKSTFQNCERLLRLNKWQGSECEQVAESIALMQFMVKHVSENIKDLRKQFEEYKRKLKAEMHKLKEQSSSVERESPLEERKG